MQTASFGCAPYNAVFINNTIAGETYFWDFGDGTTSTLENPIHLYTVPKMYTITLIAANIGTCNKKDTTTFQLTISSPPVADFNFSPNPPKENTPVNFFNSSTNAVWFVWQYGDGDSLAVNNTNSVQHSYNQTKVFTACLYAFNKSGCPDTVCRAVAARILPLLDVSNAFTPNNDGANDKVYVRGFGIVKMLWRIYDRWGIVVFETTDRNQGWDGKYKGTLQPMEVYHYTLDVIYSDDSAIKKQGDITIIR